MTVSTDLNNARYEGNGVTDTFAFNGRIFSTADLAVDIITRATDVLVETLTGSDYTVTIIGPESVSVQVSAGKIPTGSQDILIRRSLGYTQPLRLPTGTVFPAVDVENGLDRNVAQMQDIAADIGRAIKLPVTSSLTDIELPQPTPSEIIGWNAAGDNLTTYSFAEIIGSVDTIFTTLSVDDFLVYNGTKWTNIDNDSLPVDGVVATSSAGVSIKNNTGTPVVILGAGSGTGASFAGGVNVSGSVSSTGLLAVSGTSASPAYITLAEDTDNGTNKATIIAPASIASDYTVTLPGSSGTMATESYVLAQSASKLLLVQTISASASINVTSIITSEFDTYVIEIQDLIPATDNVSLWMRTSSNNGTSWDSGASDYSHIKTGIFTGSTATFTSQALSDNTCALAAAISNGAGRSFNATIKLRNPLNSSLYTTGGFVSSHSDNTNQLSNFQGSFRRTSASAVNAFQFLMSSGNITSGVVRVYGIRKS